MKRIPTVLDDARPLTDEEIEKLRREWAERTLAKLREYADSNPSFVINSDSNTSEKEILSVFNPLPLSGIAKLFPLERDEQRNLALWKKHAENAFRNGLKKNQSFTR